MSAPGVITQSAHGAHVVGHGIRRAFGEAHVWRAAGASLIVTALVLLAILATVGIGTSPSAPSTQAAPLTRTTTSDVGIMDGASMPEIVQRTKGGRTVDVGGGAAGATTDVGPAEGIGTTPR